jgi:hypothetical protein
VATPVICIARHRESRYSDPENGSVGQRKMKGRSSKYLIAETLKTGIRGANFEESPRR